MPTVRFDGLEVTRPPRAARRRRSSALHAVAMQEEQAPVAHAPPTPTARRRRARCRSARSSISLSARVCASDRPPPAVIVALGQALDDRDHRVAHLLERALPCAHLRRQLDHARVGERQSVAARPSTASPFVDERLVQPPGRLVRQDVGERLFDRAKSASAPAAPWYSRPTTRTSPVRRSVTSARRPAPARRCRWARACASAAASCRTSSAICASVCASSNLPATISIALSGW